MLRSALGSLRECVRHNLRMALSRNARRHSRARFVGITGSSAKSTTGSLLTHILTTHGEVRSRLLSNTFRDISRSIRASGKDADYFVIEAGVEKSGDMDDMAKVIQPDIAIVTMVGFDHRQAFRSKEAVAAEKAKLVAAVQPRGLAILNHDDPRVRSMASHTASELGVPIDTIARQCASFKPLNARCEVIEAGDGPAFIVDTFKAPWESLPLAFRIVETAQAPR